MAKIPDYNLALIPQEVADLLDELKFNWNFGKYQLPIVTTAPDWRARLGETAIYASANTWALMVCSSDETTEWVTISAFQQAVPYSGIVQTPVDSTYPTAGRLGEMRFFASAGSWALMVNTTDGSTNWVSVSNFEDSVAFSGREHIPIVSDYPAYNGRLGEMVLYAKANTWALLACTSDNTTEWSSVSTFFQGATDYAKKQLPVEAVYPLAAGKLGETRLYAAANTWALLACTSDGTTNWAAVSTFRPDSTQYGLTQMPVVAAYPVGSGRLGEMKLYSANNTWSLLTCVSDQTTTWVAMSNFFPSVEHSGRKVIPVVSVLPSGIGNLGELQVYTAANTWALMMCTSDRTTRWVAVSNFFS